MWRRSTHLIACSALLLAACNGFHDGRMTTMHPGEWPSRLAQDLKPPIAERREHTVASPNGDRSDPYYWLRDDGREDADVLAYLKAENDYADALLKPLADTTQALLDEMTRRVPRDDQSVPYRWKDHWYYNRHVDGSDYALIARRRGSMNAPEQVMLDQPAMAGDADFFSIADWAVSPDQRRIAWVEDRVGRRQYTLLVKDLETGEVLADRIDNVSDALVWSGDSQSLLYIENDATTLLGRWVKRHRLGTPVSDDVLVYEETDEAFYLDLHGTTSEDFLCIHAESTTTSEVRCAPADDPENFRVIAPRETDVLYYADQFGDRWLIQTDRDAPNFRIVEVGNDELGDPARWTDVVAHSPQVFINDFAVFERFLAIDERSNALRRLRVIPDHGDSFHVTADDPAYTMSLGDNPDPHSRVLRYEYESLTMPHTVYDLDVFSGQRAERKRQTVPGGYEPGNYRSERRFIEARDGTEVPVSLVYRKDFRRDGRAPLYQYGYGAYGITADPWFDTARLSLLDRGVVFAVAHVRGSQILGRHWYDDGRLGNKLNSFTDFIDVTRGLLQLEYAAPDRVAAEGASAGGLLMGAIANIAPRDYRVIAAGVPFVDVVTTMLDESIPLTTNEYDEWGNPNEADAYATMLSYSPYDNVQRSDYPAMYVSTGLWDSQVQYWEPAKWVARLRQRKTDDRPLVLRTDMDAGHGGKSGRYRKLEQIAEKYAFVLDQLGVQY
ncbi:MAG: S9 family peptidase [Lysobacteraceae bacterium]